MVEIEIDGKSVEMPEGSMVMHAANKLGIYVPHFCYHKKLSIAANCRMCLVEVEKAPKPLPACATPVSKGMKVYTRSPKAIAAQQSVMEFLLINHPLDCPICDQGGECQLQDLAVGYGGSNSNYTEDKRVVFHKPMGPLISAEEMTRCIHCTRCVRFGQEVAGVMELGMANRGEHSEIMTFVGQSVNSELSGNMIDICPVGALTSKPFRYSARTWELSRRKSVAPHDSLGSNLTVQIKGRSVMRVVPLENEAINECWLSDRDRFSYEGLNAPDRLLQPMIRRDGQWQVTDWQSALNQAALSIATARVDHGSSSVGALAGGQSTFEELYLAQKLMRGIGSDNVDFRLRQTDFAIDRAGDGAPWLGMPVQAVSELDHLLLVGCTLRSEQPLLAARIRTAVVQRGLGLSVLHAADDNLLMPVANRLIAAPRDWRARLLMVLAAAVRQSATAFDSELAGDLQGIEPDESALATASALLEGEQSAILLGNLATQHPQYTDLLRLAGAIGQVCQARVGVLGAAANSVGGYLAGATPRAIGAIHATPCGNEGLDAAGQTAGGIKAFLLTHVEPSLDMSDGGRALKALAAADVVVALSAWRCPDLMEVADVLLPVSAFSETAGSFVNAEGRLQAFNGVVPPQGEARPAWKVLRVLGNLLEVKGFDFDSVEDVRREALVGPDADKRGAGMRLDELTGPDARLSVFEDKLSVAVSGALACAQMPARSAGQLERIADVPTYAVDSLVRRAPSLQQTVTARQAVAATAHPETLAELGLSAGDSALLGSAEAGAGLPLRADPALCPGVIRVPAGIPETVGLADAFAPVTVRRI